VTLGAWWWSFVSFGAGAGFGRGVGVVSRLEGAGVGAVKCAVGVGEHGSAGGGVGAGGPFAFVLEAVVVAQQHQVVDVVGAARGPPVGVVHVATTGGQVTAGEGAAAVAQDDRFA
jgi:hypothetical protein